MAPAPLYLIGYRGTGKSTVARVVAARLGRPWCDADQLLEQTHGKSIRQIFADEGEAGFRAKEAAILQGLSTRTTSVIATGGGVVLLPENRALLKQGHVVWLQAAPEAIWRRLQADAATAERRPNLAQGGMAEIEQLLTQREPFYRECAQHVVDATSASPEAIADDIAGWLVRVT